MSLELKEKAALNMVEVLSHINACDECFRKFAAIVRHSDRNGSMN